MKKILYYILLLCDAIPVICMVLFAIIREDTSSTLFVMIALLMFIWHNGENYLKKKYVLSPRKASFNYLKNYPHIAFSVVVVISSCEYFLDSHYRLYLEHILFRITAIVLIVLGISIRISCIKIQKAVFFEVPYQRKRIIKLGFYKYFKHPASYGFFMISLGISLGFASIWAILITCTLVLFSLQMICRQQDQFLKNKVI